MTIEELLFDSSCLLDGVINIENNSPWVRVCVYDRLALEMTESDYFNAEINAEILYELLNTAVRVGQESVREEEK